VLPVGDVRSMLQGKSVEERCRIAARLGPMFDPDHPSADARAAEELARFLVEDAVVLVREALAQGVRHSRFLPKPLAKRIAHDIETVAGPFLEVTEVFSDEELQALAITVAEHARSAIARRTAVSEQLAHSLAEVGGPDTARTLLGNKGAQLGGISLRLLYERFEHEASVLEQMTGRPELPLDVVENLFSRVSRAASRKLSETYGVPDFTEPLIAEARSNALLRALRDAPSRSLASFVQGLDGRNELCPLLILRALRGGHVEFFEMAMATRADIPIENVRKLMRQGGALATAKLSQKAGIPAYLRESYRDAVEMALAMITANASAGYAGYGEPTA